MASSRSWTCGCGHANDEPTCPECGWERAAPGQPEGGLRRWLPLVAGVVAIVLPMDAVAVLAHDAQPVRFTKTGQAIGRLPADQDEGLPPAQERALPADLAALVPGAPDTYRLVTTSPVSGPLDVGALAALGQRTPAAIAAARNRLTSSGFQRAQAQTFASPTTRLVLGVIYLQFDTADHARSYLRVQRTVLRSSGQPVLHDGPAGVIFRETPAPGSTVHGLDSLYPVDQLVVQEFVASPDHEVAEADLTAIHAAVTRSLALS
jgi:hypothetical protein